MAAASRRRQLLASYQCGCGLSSPAFIICLGHVGLVDAASRDDGEAARQQCSSFVCQESGAVIGGHHSFVRVKWVWEQRIHQDLGLSP